MAVKSCSHWWHAPVYFTFSAALALIAISSFPPQTPSSTPNDATIFSSNATLPTATSVHIFHNASATLRTNGFTIIAALLELSPDIFFSPTSSSTTTTLFALPDSAISNSSLPHWARKLLLQYHTVPSQNLPFKSLLRISSNTCLATRIPSKNIAFTRIRPQERLVEINHARISHPDLFLSGPISIHGVLAPFTTLLPQETNNYSPDFIHSPNCSSSAANLPNWKHIVFVLSRHGFISFAVGLNSVLDSILRDFPEMDSGTIFAPREFHSVDSPDPVLDRLVRFHVLPERYEFSELASLPEKTRFRTLIKGEDLEITSAFNATKRSLTIDGVSLTAPDVCSTGGFAVHAIARAFAVDAHSNTK